MTALYKGLMLVVIVAVGIIKPVMATEFQKVYFAGGCFWCMEPVFDIIPGVTDTVVGYMGGDKTTANYSMVSSGKTQHIETIEVTFDPEKVSYRTLLDAFWRSIDPTDQYGQFADKGPHYQTAIFVASIDQQEEAQRSLEDLAKLRKFKDPIVTKILPVEPFFPAEEYHQNYYQKNAVHYNAYKIGSGRAGFLEKVWKK
ncbi:MAG: peptide-methionine (S)-S-oxide reductase MsrA [Candidatus Marinamargulisbacteria bacterium]